MKTVEVFVFDHKEVLVDKMTRKEAIEAVRIQARELGRLQSKLKHIGFHVREFVEFT